MTGLKLFCRLSECAVLTRFHLEARWDRLKKRISDEQGAIAIEYILIIALIALIIITLFTVLLWPVIRPVIVDLINRINNALNGGGIS